VVGQGGDQLTSGVGSVYDRKLFGFASAAGVGADAAGDVGVLVEVVAGADAVVPIGDL
jgi:hypothetical protein